MHKTWAPEKTPVTDFGLNAGSILKTSVRMRSLELAACFPGDDAARSGFSCLEPRHGAVRHTGRRSPLVALTWPLPVRQKRKSERRHSGCARLPTSPPSHVVTLAKTHASSWRG